MTTIKAVAGKEMSSKKASALGDKLEAGDRQRFVSVAGERNNRRVGGERKGRK